MLTPDQQQQLVKFLNERRKNHLCPRCGENNWSVNGQIRLSVQDIGDATIVIGGPTMPLAAFSCRVCAHTEFVNLIIAGVITPVQPPPPAPPVAK
jgi:hypothetical protein